MTRIDIDRARCEGHGRCYDIATEFFESDDFGHGRLIPGSNRDGADLDPVARAADACPERAVIFEK